MQIVNGILAILNIYILSRMIKSNYKTIDLFLAFNIFVIASAILGIILLILNHYSLIATQVIMLIVLLYFIASNFNIEICNFEITKKEICWFLTFALLMLVFVAQRFEHFEQTGDAGVYSSYAISLINGGGLFFEDDIAEHLDPEQRSLYYSNNFLPGTYNDKNSATYYFQFYKGWPVAMANFGSIFGQNNVQYTLVLLYLLLISNVFLLIRCHIKNRENAILLFIIFASSPLLIYFSKYPTSEVFLLYLLSVCTLFMCTLGKKGNILAGVAAVLISVTHIQNFFFLPILFLLVLYGYIKNKNDIFITAEMGFAGIILSIPYGYFVSQQYFLDIFRNSFKSVELGTGLIIVVSLVGILLCLNPIRVKLKNSKIVSEFINLLDSECFNIILSRIFVSIFLVLTVIRGYQLGWTNKYMPLTVNNYSSWDTSRPLYINKGFVSLMHLNIFSICLSTVLIAVPVILIVYFCSRKIHNNRISSFAFHSFMIQLLIYTVIRPDTPSNYYASRYFLFIIFPNIIMLLYFIFEYLHEHLQVGYRLLCISLVLIVLSFNLPHDIFLLANQNFGGRLELLEEVVDAIPDKSILFVTKNDIGEYLFPTYLKATQDTYVITTSTPNINSESFNEIYSYLNQLGRSEGYFLTKQKLDDTFYLCKSFSNKRTEYSYSILYPMTLRKSNTLYYLYSLNSDDVLQYYRDFNKYTADKKIHFNSKEKNYLRYYKSGLSSPEEKFTWSDDTNVCFYFKCMDVNNDLLLRTRIAPYLYEGISSQTVKVQANGKQVGIWNVDKEDEYVADIPSDLVANGDINLTFEISDPKSPKDAGRSNDSRLLGIRFYEMSLDKSI